MTTATPEKPKERTFYTAKVAARGVAVTPTQPTLKALEGALERVRAAIGMPGLTLAKDTAAHLEAFLKQCRGEEWEIGGEHEPIGSP